MENEFVVKKILIDLFPTELLGSELNLNKLLDVFENRKEMAPTHWGTNERPRFKYDRAEILNKVINEKETEIFLHRSKEPKYTCYFDTLNINRFKNYFGIEFNISMKEKYWESVFKFSDEVSEIVKPRFGVSGIVWNRELEIRSERDKLLSLMIYTSQESPLDFPKYGPSGVGMKTYFGKEVIKLFTKELLMEVPAVVTESEWGGIRIDLSEKQWEDSPEEMFQTWIKVMEHLEKSKLLAIPNIKESGFIDFTPSDMWKNKEAILAKLGNNEEIKVEEKAPENNVTIDSEKQIVLNKIKEAQISKKQLKREKVANMDLSYADLEGLSVELFKLKNVNMKSASFIDSVLYDCRMENVNLEESSFENAGIGESYLLNCNFTKANMKNIRMNTSFCTESNFEEVDFSNGELRGTCIDEANLKNAKLINVDATMASFNDSNLTGADLSNGCFDKASFLNAKLDGVIWKGANIKNAEFSPDVREEIEKLV